MMKNKVNRNTLIFAVTVVVLMSLVFLVAYFSSTGSVSDKALADMRVVAKDRAQLVEAYIQGCCDYLEGFSKTTEVRSVLENPLDSDRLKAVRDTTSRISKDMENLEGLYVAKWDTYVLAHNNPDSMNQRFRDKEGALELEDQIKKVGKAFCTGIVEAPVTKRMVIPVYAPVKNDNGEMIGFAGAAFYTDGLEECLMSLKGRGIDKVGYSVINVKKNQYIFAEDQKLVGTECKDEVLKQAIVKAHTDIDFGGYYSYSGDNSITSCYYMTNRDWAFVVTEENSEVFSNTTGVDPIMIIVCIGSALLMIVAYLICMYGSLPKEKNDGNDKKTSS